MGRCGIGALNTRRTASTTDSMLRIIPISMMNGLKFVRIGIIGLLFLVNASRDKSGANPSTDKLTLSNNLNAAMITNFQCTSEQVDKLWFQVAQGPVN